ncbi:MAG: FIST C-terminal domain-containing protein [Gammaproteobacteria bacterium]
MKIDTLVFGNSGWQLQCDEIDEKARAQLVLVFGDSDTIKLPSCYDALRALYPEAHIVGSSSCGNILGPEIANESAIATAVHFNNARIAISTVEFTPNKPVADIAVQLVTQLPKAGLRHVFVLADGLTMSGSELVRALNQTELAVPVTGGMAGDNDRFQETWILADAPAKQSSIVAIGFYGDDLIISSGCRAGWNPFGADDRPALDLYQEYLGEFAKDLPGSGLRFPLSIREHDNAPWLIRGILGIDEQARSISFAGDVPEGYTARLMNADLNRLIDGAGEAAQCINVANDKRALGLVVSCVGRRIVMKQITEEELDVIEDVVGSNVQLSGFYSYGELSPFENDILNCHLHNQTMMLTAIYEK